jgi:hypothetical protein
MLYEAFSPMLTGCDHSVDRQPFTQPRIFHPPLYVSCLLLITGVFHFIENSTEFKNVVIVFTVFFYHVCKGKHFPDILSAILSEMKTSENEMAGNFFYISLLRSER